MTEQVTEVSINQYKRAIKDMSRESIIRFQLVFHCYLNNIEVNSARLQCLTVLGVLGETDLSQFCDLMKEQQVFLSVESTRSRLTALQDEGLILKSNSKYRKTIQLHPDLKIQTRGNVMVDVKLLSMENQVDVSEESQGSDS